MSLHIQLLTLLSSFLFGIFFYFQVFLIYKIPVINNIIKLIINLLLVITNVLLYFIILRYINEGIFNIYCLFTILLGYFIAYKIK